MPRSLDFGLVAETELRLRSSCRRITLAVGRGKLIDTTAQGAMPGMDTKPQLAIRLLSRSGKKSPATAKMQCRLSVKQVSLPVSQYARHLLAEV